MTAESDEAERASRPEMDPELYRKLRYVAVRSRPRLSVIEAMNRFAGPGITAEYERMTLAEAAEIVTRRGAQS